MSVHASQAFSITHCTDTEECSSRGEAGAVYQASSPWDHQ